MARPKAFDRSTALQAAIGVFADHGYEGSSTEALLGAMEISRQSLYDTFGDKRRLYLEALGRYNTDSTADLIGRMDGEDPLAGLEAALVAFASRPATQAGLGCMGVGAICEFGRSDPEVSALGDRAGEALGAALVRRIAQAKAAGQTAADIDPQAAARFLGAALAGMKIAARNGADPPALRDIARMALRSLT
jgi:TetR/AcrR family transcriptional repressor of nem operon